MTSRFEPGWPLPAHLGRYKGSGAWREMTLPALARAHAEAAPDNEVIVGGAPPMTAARAVTEAEALAAALQDLGLRAGDRVAFQLPNWEETVVIALAISIGGFVAVPIVPIYRDAEVLQMLADCDCRAIFLTPRFRKFDYAAMADRIRPSLPGLRNVIYVRGESSGLSYCELLAAGPCRAPAGVQASPDSAKLLLYTSGTTGRPKGVLHSQNTLNAALDMCVRHWGIGADDTMLMPSPVTHLTGYAFLELPFVIGSRTLLMESWNADEAVRLIDQHNVIGTVSATPFLVELTEAARRTGTRLPSLRFFACGGAAVPPDAIREANAWLGHTAAFRIFGCTEAPLITIGFLGVDQGELAATTDGRIGNYEVSVLDEQDRALPTEMEGEIAARGPSMMLGYLNPSQTETALTSDGFYRTGDLGVTTDGGAVIITGRKKDLIIRGGENISPKEIEDVLHAHPAVAEAAVVAMPHPRLGEGVCAFIVVAPQQVLDTQMIVDFVARSGLAPQKIPERVEFREMLSKTATGKVRKDLLRNELL